MDGTVAPSPTFVPVTRHEVYDNGINNGQLCRELTEFLYPGDGEMINGHNWGDTYADIGTLVDESRFLEVWRGQMQRLVCVYVKRFDHENFVKHAGRLGQVHAETGFPLVGIADQCVVAVDWPWEQIRKFLHHLAEMGANAFATMMLGWVFVVVRNGNIEYYAMWEGEEDGRSE
ncbi:hypothetical protein CCB81_12875 [Armatimonadetes bacterium Uphvl-Ar2]|nr:hypothetical protein CCB81_12875 [Armatimonadetes bacterium Uphvl-Ar2]